MLAAVLADLGRPLPTSRFELPLASILLKRLSSSLVDHHLDGNSLKNLIELHCLSEYFVVMCEIIILLMSRKIKKIAKIVAEDKFLHTCL